MCTICFLLALYVIAIAATAGVFYKMDSIQRGKLWGDYGDTLVVAVIFGGVVVFGMFVVAGAFIFVSPHNPGAEEVAVMWALASLICGSILGFLFGVPQGSSVRSPAASKDQAATEAQTAAAVNQGKQSNLEQISDWLTKILLGAGLTQLQNVPGYLRKLSRFVATGFGQPPVGTGNPFEALALGITIAFGGFGFLGGILLTKLFLAKAFSKAKQAASESKIDEALAANAPGGPQDPKAVEEAKKAVQAAPLPVEPGQTPLQVDDPAAAQQASQASAIISTVPISELKTPEDYALWAKATLNAGDYSNAVKGYAKAVQTSPDNISLRLGYAVALNNVKERDPMARQQLLEAYDRVNELGVGSDEAQSVYNALIYSYLFDTPPNGFMEAIRLCNEYINKPNWLQSGAIFVNLACAYGQRVAWLKNNPNATLETNLSNADDQKKSTDAALDAINRALSIDDAMWKERFRQLMVKDYPGKGREDIDLKVFENEPRFREVLGLPPVASATEGGNAPPGGV